MNRIPLPLWALLLIAAGCSSMSIRSDFDPEADFSQYRTYRFVPEKQVPGQDPLTQGALVRKRVHNAVRAHLEPKGYEFSESGSADLLVAYHVEVKEKVDVATREGYRHWNAWGGAGGGVDVYRYDEGTLILDLIDAKSKDLVWRGWAVAVVGDNPGKSGERIDEAVRQILAQYPPEPKPSKG